MIVDDADKEIDMVSDPFLEAGISIPQELPYQSKSPSSPKPKIARAKLKSIKSTLHLHRHHVRRGRKISKTEPDNISFAGSIASTTASMQAMASKLIRFEDETKMKSNNDDPSDSKPALHSFCTQTSIPYADAEDDHERSAESAPKEFFSNTRRMTDLYTNSAANDDLQEFKRQLSMPERRKPNSNKEMPLLRAVTQRALWQQEASSNASSKNVLPAGSPPGGYVNKALDEDEK